MVQFWYSFGTFSHKNVPKVYHVLPLILFDRKSMEHFITYLVHFGVGNVPKCVRFFGRYGIFIQNICIHFDKLITTSGGNWLELEALEFTSITCTEIC